MDWWAQAGDCQLAEQASTLIYVDRERTVVERQVLPLYMSGSELNPTAPDLPPDPTKYPK